MAEILNMQSSNTTARGVLTLTGIKIAAQKHRNETKRNKRLSQKAILPQLVKTHIKTGKHLDGNLTSLFAQ